MAAASISCRHRGGTCLGLLLMLLLWLVPAAARDISPQRECSICHVMWLTEFNQSDATPLIPYDPKPVVASGKQDVVSTERMCFSCHDGFVRDSRFAWAKREHFHPVGVKPSDKVEIPRIDGKEMFPLNEEGKVYCGTCHSAHGIDWSEEFSPLFLRVKNVDSSLCLACHIDRATGTREGNHPILQPLAQIPQPLQDAGAKFGRKDEVICQSCHRIHGAGDRKLLVVPNADSQLCGNCHTDKLAVQGTRHDAMKMPTEAGKSPPGGRLCGTCHAPHKGQGPRMWARPPAAGAPDAFSSTCLGCHSKGAPAQEKTIGAHSHPVGVPLARLGIKSGAQGWSYTMPAGDGSGREVTPPLFDQFRERMEKVEDRTCATCHWHKTPLPLYDKGGHRADMGNVSCGTCHDPHRWSPLEEKAPAAQKEAPASGENSFLRIANDRDDMLCTNCHLDKGLVGLSKHNLAINKGQEKNIKGQQAAQTSACGSCHLPHNGSGPRMWARPPGPGKEATTRMCQGCHQPKAVASGKVVGANSHPLGVGVKARLGVSTELPQYDAAGHHDANGEMGCPTCHDPHRWDPADLHAGLEAGDGSEGTANNSFLRQPAAPEGALCANCHQDKRWVRKTDHDLRITAPADRNARGQSARESGVCGQCHAVHNAGTAPRLWAREPGPGQDTMETMCRSCHADGKVAAAKQPHKASHPAGVVALTAQGMPRPGEKAATPVFDASGAEAGSGVISCPTCHNPHRWSALREAEGPGRPSEGDVRNSFLRNASDASLCKNCHGLDALFRYKYFHGEGSRTQHKLFR